MQVLVKGKQVQVGDALRTYVADRLSGAVNKYFDDAIEAQVIFSREGHGFETTISVHALAGVTPQSHATHEDIHVSFDAAATRVEKQLRRYKRRLRNHHHKTDQRDAERLAAQQYTLAGESHESEEEEPETLNPVIVAETTTVIEALTVGEAVMHMNLADLPALMFRNSAHGGFNMVYQRRDGSIGWIDPRLASDGS